MNVYFPYKKLYAGSLTLAHALADAGHTIVEFQEDVQDLTVDLVVCRIPNDIEHEYRQQALTQTQQLQDNGAVAVNSPESQQTMFDKHLTNICLAKHCLPMPEPYHVDQLWPRQGVVGKPATGSKGQGVVLHRSRSSLLAALADNPDLVVQRFVEGITVRVIATNQSTVMAYQKIPAGSHFGASVAQGATTAIIVVDDQLAAMAMQAVSSVGATMAGVDFIVADGQPVILELNAGFRIPTEFDKATDLVCKHLEALCM